MLYKWKKYLSFRVAVFFVCFSALALCGITAVIPAPAAILGLIVGFIGGCIWIVRPYFVIEGLISLFLEGYPLPQEDAAENLAISPVTHALFKQYREAWEPYQSFNMNKRQAQYLALQNQINPHFLYNTLESIRSEALLAGLNDAADIMESLATFFRYTITKVENLVSVEEELLNCETYFSIQQYRFGNRLRLAIQYTGEKDEIYRCRLPKLTMQPILENSIIHGTELKVGTGHLTIYMECTEKRLLIRISDDGLGMDEEKLAAINESLDKGAVGVAQDQKAKGGLALINVNNRIKLLFGDEYGIHVFSVPGAGTDVEISLPAINSDRDIKAI